MKGEEIIILSFSLSWWRVQVHLRKAPFGSFATVLGFTSMPALTSQESKVSVRAYLFIYSTTSQSKPRLDQDLTALLTWQLIHLSPQVCLSDLVQIPDVDHSCMTCLSEHRWLNCHSSWLWHGWFTYVSFLLIASSKGVWCCSWNDEPSFWNLPKLFFASHFDKYDHSSYVSVRSIRHASNIWASKCLSCFWLWRCNINILEISMRWCTDVRSGLESMNNAAFFTLLLHFAGFNILSFQIKLILPQFGRS